MGLRRALRFVGLTSLLAAGGCVALSGLGDLRTEDDGAPVAEGGAKPGDASGSTTSGSASSSGYPFDVNLPDVGFPFDPSLFDGSVPDTGGPEAGPAGAGVVQCSANLQCKDGVPCCYSLYFPVPTCGGSTCAGAGGLLCDDDTDCPGKMCCISSVSVAQSASSSCAETCGMNATHACSTDADCDNGTKCKHAPFAPQPIKSCQ